MFEPQIAKLPVTIQSCVNNSLKRLLATISSEQYEILLSKRQQVVSLLAGSDYLTRLWMCHPSWLVSVLQDDRLKSPKRLDFASIIDLDAIMASKDRDELMRNLRIIRHYQLSCIACRDLLGWADIVTIVQEQSSLADQLIIAAYSWLKSKLQAQEQLAAVPDLIIVALGKLGGFELNFSSDVDVIFIQPNCQQSQNVPAKFYTRLAQNFIAALSEITADGFVYRVDTRLRPHGSRGPLVISELGLANYLQDHSRHWERYALMKARVIVGDDRNISPMIERFVYRSYVDFNMRLAIRQMHAKIANQRLDSKHKDDIKLGVGGIREIEFIVQAYQLIYSGQSAQMRQRRLNKALSTLLEQQLLSTAQVKKLQANYWFWRRLENRLQLLLDQQTHKLPDSPVMAARVAYTLGYEDCQQLAALIANAREQVSLMFYDLLAPSIASKPDQVDSDVRYKFLSKLKSKLAASKDGGQLVAKIEHLLAVACQSQNQFKNFYLLLTRFSSLIEQLIRRPTYITLLYENSANLQLLLSILHDSSFLAARFCRYPFLLATFVRAQKPKILTRPELSRRLQENLAQAVDEQVLEVLRHEKLRQETVIAVAELNRELDLKDVSNHLASLAEVILVAVQRQAWQDLTPCHDLAAADLQDVSVQNFAVIAYGKLGGYELSYNSDLDLVFLYHDQQDSENRQQRRQIYAQLAQRMVTILQTYSYSGRLYEIDLQLRPSGGAGLLVSSLSAFAQYQQNEAWLWEHQALLRARVVTGVEQFAKPFAQIRKSVLVQTRDQAGLRQTICDMRAKMRKQNLAKNKFDLKQCSGGIIDLEFLVQFWVLAYASSYPELIAYTDNLRMLEQLAASGILTEATSQRLTEIYLSYRQQLHLAILVNREVDAASCQQDRTKVEVIWQQEIVTTCR